MFNETLEYYNSHADEYANATQHLEFDGIHDRFLLFLSHNAQILDFGCGSGRDAKYFSDLGYRVDAVDGSEKMCEIASKYTGKCVKRMLFHDLTEIDKYDGIWACASLLHVPFRELPDILEKCKIALKENGVMYMSFKVGTGERHVDGKHYTDFDENAIRELVSAVHHMKIDNIWYTNSSILGREREQWINIILEKKHHTNSEKDERRKCNMGKVKIDWREENAKELLIKSLLDLAEDNAKSIEIENIIANEFQEIVDFEGEPMGEDGYMGGWWCPFTYYDIRYYASGYSWLGTINISMND